MKKTKRALREERILQHFQDLIEERGFFDLKVSELAQRADISVGTLYSHFPCKEDLLLALSFQSKSSRAAVVRRAVEQVRMPNQRFIVGIIEMWRSYQTNISLTELEFLSMTPSIWKRGSTRFQEANTKLRKELFYLFKDLLRDAFNQLPSSLSTSYIDFGQRSLLIGMDVMSFAEFEGIRSDFQDATWEDCMLQNMSCLLIGWGFPKEEVEAMIKSGLEITS